MSLVRLLVALALAGGAGFGGLALRRRSGDDGPATGPQRLSADERPGPAGLWTVLGFTSPLCVACSETPRIAAESLGVEPAELKAGPVDGVLFRSVDVREHPSLVERLDVTRTPTVAVVDPEGRVVFRAERNPAPEALRDRLPEPAEARGTSIGRGAALTLAVPRREGDR